MVVEVSGRHYNNSDACFNLKEKVMTKDEKELAEAARTNKFHQSLQGMTYDFANCVISLAEWSKEDNSAKDDRGESELSAICGRATVLERKIKKLMKERRK